MRPSASRSPIRCTVEAKSVCPVVKVTGSSALTISTPTSAATAGMANMAAAAVTGCCSSKTSTAVDDAVLGAHAGIASV